MVLNEYDFDLAFACRSTENLNKSSFLFSNIFREIKNITLSFINLSNWIKKQRFLTLLVFFSK